MTLATNPDIEALARDLERMAATVATEPAEVVDAREAIRRASAGDGDRSLLLARMAVDRARRAVGSAGAARPSWRDALQAPVRPPDAPREGRRRPTLASRNPDVELDSEIPAAHPAKSAIEASVTGAFVGVKGRWRVAILVQPNAPWWGIRVEGTSICWTGTLEGPDEQSPEFLAGRVREAVQLGVMQAALPRQRSRH